jgi:hypothetical protein
MRQKVTIDFWTLSSKIIQQYSYQRFEGLKIFNLVIADAEVRQLGTFLEGVQARADSVVAQFEFFQLRQLWECFQTEINDKKNDFN